MISFQFIVIVAILLTVNYAQQVKYVLFAGTSTGTVISKDYLITKIYSTASVETVIACPVVNATKHCVGDIYKGTKIKSIRNLVDVVKLNVSYTPPPNHTLFNPQDAKACRLYGWGTSKGLGIQMKVVDAERVTYGMSGKLKYTLVADQELYMSDVGGALLCKGQLVGVISTVVTDRTGLVFTVNKLLQLIDHDTPSLTIRPTTTADDDDDSGANGILMNRHWTTVFSLTTVLALLR